MGLCLLYQKSLKHKNTRLPSPKGEANGGQVKTTLKQKQFVKLDSKMIN
ncbi:MAG: hypothetical protein ABIJ91_02775 [Candidatus Kuenenbacteria bacterium]